MNFDFYLLGTPNGYDQYPLDNKTDLFRSFHDEVKSDTQMTIWRNAEVVYYVYTRNLRTAGTNQYFGMVIAINGLYLSHIGNVFNVFEQLCSNIALRGSILQIDSTGKIKFVHSRFIDTPDEIETTIRDCRDLVEINLRNDFKHLPDEYVVPRKTISVTYNENFGERKLNDLLKEYNCIHFTKAENEKSGYIDMVVTRLYEENHDLKERYTRLQHQKKQIRWVLFLLIMIIIGGVVFFFYAQDASQLIKSKSDTISDLNDTLQNKDVQIQSKSQIIQSNTETIFRLDSTIREKNEQIKSLQNETLNLTNTLNQKTKKLDEAQRKLTNINRAFNNTFSAYTYFDSWKSSNYKQSGSVSSKTYSFYAYADDELNIPYYVSSEKGYDYLTITIQRTGMTAQQLLKTSGVDSGVYKHTFTASDSYELVVSYSKDGSNNHNNDNAGVKRMYIYHPIVERLRRMSE
ncbi:MAG: hypothetical protein MJZ90_08020 [Bacteroidales bacterium]|nr:hypothetical protein [Bacteroidales bacterium]